jgi:glycosyltransferase involved in cell wall biosynthesis
MGNDNIKLSAAIITLNEEANLERTLKSISEIVDEIVILDSGSTDRTKEIAEKFNSQFYQQPFRNYGSQRNDCYKLCKGQWILAIDADEVVSSELANEIKKIITNNNTKHIITDKVFEINRRTIAFGKIFKYGGWGNSYAMRLFLNGAGYFSEENTVHEYFVSDFPVIKLPKNALIYHYSYQSWDDYFARFNKYTTLAANDYKKKGKRATILNILINPFFAFIKFYFLKFGFLDGLAGFYAAVVSSLYVFTKYLKIKEDN